MFPLSINYLPFFVQSRSGKVVFWFHKANLIESRFYQPPPPPKDMQLFLILPYLYLTFCHKSNLNINNQIFTPLSLCIYIFCCKNEISLENVYNILLDPVWNILFEYVWDKKICAKLVGGYVPLKVSP